MLLSKVLRVGVCIVATSAAARCGSTSTTLTGPTTTRTGSISGTVTSYGTNTALSGATVLLGGAATVTDSQGRFTLAGVPDSGSGALTVNTTGYVFRSVGYALAPLRTGVTIDAVRDADPFSLAFYRQFVRNGYEQAELQVTRPWTMAPSFYFKTVTADDGVPVSLDMIAAIADNFRKSVPELSGGKFQVAAVESGTETRDARDGWVNVTFYSALGASFGQSSVGGNSGTIQLRYGLVSSPTTNPFNCSTPELGVADHEISHTMGYWHSENVYIDSFSGNGCPGAPRPDYVRYHTTLMYLAAARKPRSRHRSIDGPPRPGPRRRPTARGFLRVVADSERSLDSERSQNMLHRMTGSTVRLAVAAIAGLSFSAAPAFGQTGQPSQSKWEFEVHSGVAVVKNPIDGNGALPLPGETFSTLNGRTSRANSTWYFGDGATLFNLASSQLGIPAASQIKSLDAVVASSSMQPRTGVPFGLRVSREISPLVRIEVSVDFRGGTVRVTDAALAAIETTRASYLTAWQALLDKALVPQGTTVSSDATIRKGTASQIVTLGSVNINFRRRGKNIPYLMVGGGVLSTTGNAPSVTLLGRYATKPGSFPFDDTDTVTVRYRLDRNLVVTMAGLGWKHFMSPKWGVRGEFREQLSHNRVRTFVDTAPVSVLAPSGFASAIVTNTAASIQLSNSQFAKSSFSGPAVSGLKTFEGTGMESRFLLTGGIFLRF